MHVHLVNTFLLDKFMFYFVNIHKHPWALFHSVDIELTVPYNGFTSFSNSVDTVQSVIILNSISGYTIYSLEMHFISINT